MQKLAAAEKAKKEAESKIAVLKEKQESKEEAARTMQENPNATKASPLR